MTSVSTNFIPLQAEGAGDAEVLGLKRWVGEVYGAYARRSVTEGRFNFKSISGGATEAQFPVAARRGDEYFARGDDILEDSADASYVKTLPMNEVVVRLDRPNIASSFLDQQDSVLSHYDANVEMRIQAGETLARRQDRQRLICALRGAHRYDGASGNEDTFVDGLKPAVSSASPTVLEDADFVSAATSTEATIALMAERFDDLEVPDEGRMMFVTPQVYWHLLENLDDHINTDFRGEGSKARGQIRYIHGFEIIKTTNLPTTDISSNPTNVAGGSTGNDYRVKGATLQALFARPDSIAEVRLGSGFNIESGYLINRMGTLVNPYYVGGKKELRPESCGAIYTTIPASAPNYS